MDLCEVMCQWWYVDQTLLIPLSCVEEDCCLWHLWSIVKEKKRILTARLKKKLCRKLCFVFIIGKEATSVCRSFSCCSRQKDYVASASACSLHGLYWAFLVHVCAENKVRRFGRHVEDFKADLVEGCWDLSHGRMIWLCLPEAALQTTVSKILWRTQEGLLSPLESTGSRYSRLVQLSSKCSRHSSMTLWQYMDLSWFFPPTSRLHSPILRIPGLLLTFHPLSDDLEVWNVLINMCCLYWSGLFHTSGNVFIHAPRSKWLLHTRGQPPYWLSRQTSTIPLQCYIRMGLFMTGSNWSQSFVQGKNPSMEVNPAHAGTCWRALCKRNKKHIRWIFFAFFYLLWTLFLQNFSK